MYTSFGQQKCKIKNKIKMQLSTCLYHVVFNTLERDFQISKCHLIGHTENKIMGYTIVSGNKPSLAALHQIQVIASVKRINCLDCFCR